MDAIELNKAIYLAANWISQADGLLITAGAGMGVDSGLPASSTKNWWCWYCCA